ncbi:hypothetical protein M0812_03239 [Anaeramoeba flamelloides]|uniref:Uncharacterized protein n=1 Tax=Anaeramoeba flamelloides TaxID=1746091 RepID=A0AAV8ACW5_9EUKA|nr:hypothetical protein M0812_03239 [Anaeramoeba flamelloides]
MFLTQINGKKALDYDPKIQHFLNGRVVIDLDNVESSVSKSVRWTRKLFNAPELTEEEIYDSTCTNLLNIVNVLFPTYHNFVASVKTPTSALKENYSEICKVLISVGYPEEKLPQTNKIIQNNTIDKRFISQMILWLKAFYEKNGVKRQNKNKVRMFYVYRECEEKVIVNKTLEEKEIDHFFATQKNVQTFEINPSIQDQSQKRFGKIKNSFWGYKPNQKNQKRFSSSSLSREISFLDKTSKREGSLLKKNLDFSLTKKKSKMDSKKNEENISIQTNQNINTQEIEKGKEHENFQANQQKQDQEKENDEKYDHNQPNNNQKQNHNTNTKTLSLTTSNSSNSMSSMTDSSGDESSTFSASSFCESSIVEKIASVNTSIDLNEIVFFDILSNKEKEGIEKLKEEEKKSQKLKEKEKTKNKNKNGMLKSKTASDLNRGRAKKRSKKANKRKRNRSSNRTKVKKTKKISLDFLDLDDDINLRRRSRKNSMISRIGNENENENNNNKDREKEKNAQKEKEKEKNTRKEKEKEKDKEKKKKRKKKQKNKKKKKKKSCPNKRSKI